MNSYYIVKGDSDSSYLVVDEYTMIAGHYDYFFGNCEEDEAATFDSIEEAKKAITWAGKEPKDVHILQVKSNSTYEEVF